MKTEGKSVVVITGGTRGLGKFLAERFMTKGDIVNVIDISQEGMGGSDRITYFRGDITNYEDIRRVFREIYAKYKRIDVLINNAAKRYFALLENAPIEDIFDTIRMNLTANYITTKEALKYMKKGGYGRVINISSNSGFRRYPKGSLYCATKAALNVFTESIAEELKEASNITINAICPSQIDLRGGADEVYDQKRHPLMSPEIIYERIHKIINSNINGEIVPVVSLRTHLFYCLDYMRRILQLSKYIFYKR